MNAVYSFFSKPYLHNNRKAQGSLDNLFFYQCWLLSVHYAKKHFSEVHLVTDSEGKRLLVDMLGLPFDKVSLELDDIQHVIPELWAYGKIIAYKVQKSPFLHIDYDAFLFQPLPERILSASVIAESLEPFSDFIYYNKNHQFLKEQGYVSQYFNRKVLPDYAYNCGVFGGSDLGFIAEYCSSAESVVSFVQQHQNDFQKLDSMHRALFSIVFEQSNLSFCCHLHNLMPELLLSQPYASDCPGYVHLKGSKQNSRVQERIKERVENEFPFEWNRILFGTIIANPKNQQYHLSEAA